MTNKKFIVIAPFRFLIKSFSYDSIVDLKWDLWTTHKIGEYRKLLIKTSSGYQTNISDLEFINYDSLEKWLVNRISLELNLERKFYIEVQQAKWNKWLNIVVISLSVFLFFVLSNGPLRTDIRIPIQIIMIFILWRLVLRLIQYQQNINTSKRRRKSKT